MPRCQKISVNVGVPRGEDLDRDLSEEMTVVGPYLVLIWTKSIPRSGKPVPKISILVRESIPCMKFLACAVPQIDFRVN